MSVAETAPGSQRLSASMASASRADAALAPSVSLDLLALTKPSITMMSVAAAAWGLLLAPRAAGWGAVLALLAGTALVVGAANALNMVAERDLDRMMPRTRLRPLPAGRLQPRAALGFGLTLALVALVLLALGVNLVTAALGATGLLIYNGAYTPLKRHTPAALPVGAVAGALPPLMGWTAATGELSWPGLALFATLFLWQVPHFLAITIFRRHEYAAAGFCTVSMARGVKPVWRRVLAYSSALIPVSLMLIPALRGGWLYGPLVLVAGAWLVWLAMAGLRRGQLDINRSARRYFRATLAYPPAVTAGLLLEALFF